MIGNEKNRISVVEYLQVDQIYIGCQQQKTIAENNDSRMSILALVWLWKRKYFGTLLCGLVTEIANLTELQIDSSAVKTGDSLRYELEPENEFDKNAVKVFKDDLYLGHIKLIHCNVFHKTKKTFKLQVQGIEKNGVLKRIFVKASL